MKKQISQHGNKKQYLLGKNIHNEKVWLEEPSWDCSWYWGFGYMETYLRNATPNKARDISSHTHFDTTILQGKSHAFDNFKEYFVETPLTDNEIWLLCDYMQTFYTLRKSAELFRHGYSYYTGRAKIDAIQDTTLEDRINVALLPQLFKKIEELFIVGDDE